MGAWPRKKEVKESCRLLPPSTTTLASSMSKLPPRACVCPADMWPHTDARTGTTRVKREPQNEELRRPSFKLHQVDEGGEGKKLVRNFLDRIYKGGKRKKERRGGKKEVAKPPP